MRLNGLKRVAMQYAPLLPGSASIIELFQQCTAPKALGSNPECAIQLKLMDRGDPKLEIEFENGSKLTVETRDKTLKDIEFMIDKRLQDIQTLRMLREEGYVLDLLKKEEIPDLEKAKKMAKPIARNLYDGLKPV